MRRSLLRAFPVALHPAPVNPDRLLTASLRRAVSRNLLISEISFGCKRDGISSQRKWRLMMHGTRRPPLFPTHSRRSLWSLTASVLSLLPPPAHHQQAFLTLYLTIPLTRFPKDPCAPIGSIRTMLGDELS